MKELSKEQKELLEMCGLEQDEYTFNSTTNRCDVYTDFNCSGQGLKSLMGVEFGEILGDFNCSFNQLKSLEGMPVNVKGDFNCSFNQLKSLEGMPFTVTGDFNCSFNQIESLFCLPLDGTIGGNLDCSNNQLRCIGHSWKTISGFSSIGQNPFDAKDACNAKYLLPLTGELDFRFGVSKLVKLNFHWGGLIENDLFGSGFLEMLQKFSTINPEGYVVTLKCYSVYPKIMNLVPDHLEEESKLLSVLSVFEL